MNWLNPIPSPATVDRLCPGLTLSDNERAALRSARMLAYAVRVCQSVALGYGVVSGVALYPQTGGMVIGIALAWLIGCAMPGMPYRVADQVHKFFKES